MPRLGQITPLVIVSDIKRSIRFYVDTLGFVMGYQAVNYAYLYRDNVAIRLLTAAEGVDIRDPKRHHSCYIDVEDLEELYESLRTRLDKLPKGRVKKPFDQFYGQREFHVIDEDAMLIMFGEPVKQ